MYRVAAFFLGLLFAMPSSSQDIPEAAQRHFNRGMAAIEMARSPHDYELAIDEFRRAQSLAPQWPDPWYNLGLVQDKAGRFRDAAVSLRQYLRLAPNAPDAATVKALVDKLEFKAEQTLADDEVPEILATIADANRWKVVARTPADQFDFHGWIRSIRREGEQLAITYSSRHDQTAVERTKPAGRHLEFRTIYLLCQPSTQADQCPEVFHYRIEAISRRLIRVKLRIWYPDIAGQMKGYASDKSFELVAR